MLTRKATVRISCMRVGLKMTHPHTPFIDGRAQRVYKRLSGQRRALTKHPRRRTSIRQLTVETTLMNKNQSSILKRNSRMGRTKHLIIGIGFGVLLIATALATAQLRTKNAFSAAQAVDSQVQVTIKQLPPENGIVPIELKCQVVRQATPDELRMLSCVVKNNTNKIIRALSIAYSISLVRGGAEFLDTGQLTRDVYVHPDFQDLNKHKFLPPGGEQIIVRGEPVRHDGAVATGVEAGLDYIEFDDATASGPNVKGADLLALIREGATRYKGWLKKKYLGSNKSIASILPLLEDASGSPAEFELNDTMQAVGADAYRKYARELYHKRGAPDLEKHLGN